MSARHRDRSCSCRASGIRRACLFDYQPGELSQVAPEMIEEQRLEDLFSPLFDMCLAFEQKFGEVALDEHNAVRADGLGYMYGNAHTTKPVHPIVDAIRTGKENRSRLIPNGNIKPESFWLPQEITLS
jgi:hypothetical protein